MRNPVNDDGNGQFETKETDDCPLAARRLVKISLTARFERVRNADENNSNDAQCQFHHQSIPMFISSCLFMKCHHCSRNQTTEMQSWIPIETIQNGSQHGAKVVVADAISDLESQISRARS
jgi:hypothetical protein